MALGDVAQGTGRTQIAHRGTLDMVQDIVGHGHEGVFLAIHLAVFLNEGQTVYIGIDHDTQVVTALGNLAHDAAEVFLQRLGVVGEISGGLAIEHGILYAQSVEQTGQDDATHRVDSVDSHTEAGIADSLAVNELESQHTVDMALVETVVAGIMAQMVYIGIVESLGLGYGEHLGTVGSGKEFALGIEELQGVPLARVVAGGDDDTTIGAAHAHCQFGSGCGGQTDINDIEAHTHEGTANDAIDHRARDAGVTAYYYLVGLLGLANECGIGCGKLYDVQRVESVAGVTAYGATNT